jgi:3-hydroxybutyryl-CoA dehydrogenase
MNPTENQQRVAVIGSGLMGHGIAQVFAKAGCLVKMRDVSADVLNQAMARIRFNLNTMAKHGLQEPSEIDGIISRIEPTTSLEEAVANADFVTEAVFEKLDVKVELFGSIEPMVPRHAILASNTSMLRISDIGKEVTHRDRLVTTHWFNPSHLIPVVEVVKGPETSQETVEWTISFLRKAGKEPVRVLKEVPGHLVNRIQFALNREILGLIENGVAAPEEIDKGVSLSFGLRLIASGAVKTMDINGLDLFYYGMRDLYQSLDNSPAPQDILRQKVERGEVGRRSGKGFYEYAVDGPLTSLEMERDNGLMELLKLLYGKDGEKKGLS